MKSLETGRRQTPRSTWRNVVIVTLLITTFISLIYSVGNVIGAITLGRKIDWGWSVYYQFMYWYVWAAFAPLIIWFARRYDPEQIGLRRVLIAILAFGLLITPAQVAIENWLVLIAERLRGAEAAEIQRRQQEFWQWIFLGFFSNYIIYLIIVAAHYGYDYYRRYRERQLRSVDLEGRLAKAELQALKMQLHPHFLFNTLNAISVLMRRDTETANRMLVRLSDLLRLTLDEVGTQEVSLKHELDFLNLYLEIEQMRFQDRLTISRNIQPVTLGAAVPNLILQPLVENAIRHGIAKRTGMGRIEIRAVREGVNLRLEVQDNGPGLRTVTSTGAGGGAFLRST